MNLPPHEVVPGFNELGFTAFTTTRQAGSFNLASEEAAGSVCGRWMGLVEALAPRATRLATALQVHGDRIIEHQGEWNGWLRDTSGADGHLSAAPGTAMAVTIADCVPIFVAHPSGLGAILHSGWKGTAAGIVRAALDEFARRGAKVEEILVHLGPAICGRCYEVGPDVYGAVTGQKVDAPALLDLRAVIATQARQAGATVTISELCTRCHNERFFSHRAGDSGRQLGVLLIRGR
ncbi:MAG: polyphenol oxidase family protein [Gammaproteobacteria bacterium]